MSIQATFWQAWSKFDPNKERGDGGCFSGKMFVAFYK